MTTQTLRRTLTVSALAVCAVVLALGVTTKVSAGPHPGQSASIVFIDSATANSGGTLPTGSATIVAGGPFAFATLAPGLVSAATLAPYDTVVLNVASAGMACTTASLSAGAKADLNTFMSAAGKKLIIYDSECQPAVDYSWLPPTFSFSTTNPGAAGAFGGTLTIVDQNILSTSCTSPGVCPGVHDIDTAAITAGTDAVGDMNVVDLTTVGSAWCKDMQGTNVLAASGNVHMYAKTAGGGLLIYNGLDIDYIAADVAATGSGQMTKIWLQELQATLALLPGCIAVAGGPDGPANTVPTKGVIGTSGTGPVIECKWELPDMNSSTTGIQYTKAPGHLHDDDMTIAPGPPVPCHGPGDTPATKPTQANGVHHMIQVAPNFENLPEQRQIQNWMAVDDPGTVSDAFWIVWEPCTTLTNPLCGLAPAPAPNLVKKLQVHGTQLTLAECQALAGTSTTDGSMIEAAVHTGQVTADSFTDLNKGMISLCNQNVKGLYHAEWPLSKDQPCGEYRIDATAVSVGGATTTLTNYIDILCTFQLKIDFGGDPSVPCAGGITWPALVPGSTSTVGGDLIFAPGCDTHPTVKNVGNDGMGLKLTYSDLVGVTFGKHIYTFDACYGRAPDATLKCFNPIINAPAQTTPTSPEIDTQVDFGTLPAQVLCANELGKLDPSVHPQPGLPADTYTGTATLVGYAVPGECYGNKHVGG